nr:DUF2498 family protein [uncultured Pseudomonas sp.]
MKNFKTKDELIEIANKELRADPSFIPGMEIYNARMEKHVLVMEGEMFFDNQSPTAKTLESIDTYNKIAKKLSRIYSIKE